VCCKSSINSPITKESDNVSAPEAVSYCTNFLYSILALQSLYAFLENRSYNFDRVLAEHVWKVVFTSGGKGAALDRANGEQLKENLLKWGGSRDPWRCLAGTLRDERVADGDEKAMALVGSWGTRSTFKE